MSKNVNIKPKYTIGEKAIIAFYFGAAALFARCIDLATKDFWD